MDISLFLAILGAACTAIGTAIGVSKYYRARLQAYVKSQSEASKKEYAAERDFAHIQRNLQSLQEGQKFILEDLERRLDKVEKKLAQFEILLRVVTIKATGDSISGIFNKPAEPE